jgi:group II intron reverse transcriptase/maturase
MQQLSNASLLKKSWKAVRRKKSKEVAKFSRGIDNVTLADFGKNEKENLASLLQRLEAGKYVPQPVKINLEEKDNGKYRPIAIPTIEDRVVQRAILELFEPYLSPIINNGVSYCGVRDEENESVTIKNAIEKIVGHVGKGYFWIFESDIVSFYDEIPKVAMLKKLDSVIPMDKSMRNLVKQYIYYKLGNPQIFEGKKDVKIPGNTKGITQGSALSPICANLYLSDFDAVMKKVFGYRFIRYVDDFIVMCKTEDEAKIAKQLAIQEIEKAALKLSPDHSDPKKTKTHIKNLKASEKIDFLGISISRRELTPKGGIKAARIHMDEILRWKNKKTDKNQYKRLLIRNDQKLDVADQMEEKISSWGEHYRYYHVEELYPELDDYIEKQTQKMRDVRSIKPLGGITLSPVISKNEWEQLFSK